MARPSPGLGLGDQDRHEEDGNELRWGTCCILQMAWFLKFSENS